MGIKKMINDKSKYKNKKSVYDGHTFDSKKEMERYIGLKMLEKIGEITSLELQKKYILIPKQKGERECSYYADFVYKNKSGETIVEDVKAYSKTKGRYLTTAEFRIKKKLMLWVHGIKITLV